MKATRLTEISIAIALALGAVIVPAQAQNSVQALPTAESGYSMCGGGACVWGALRGNPHIWQVPQPQTDDERKTAADHERAWVARCKPTSRFDKYGVERMVYAADGCEFGRTR